MFSINSTRRSRGATWRRIVLALCLLAFIPVSATCAPPTPEKEVEVAVTATPMMPEVSARISEAIKAINDNPDKLHRDYTPAVHELIELGKDHPYEVLLQTVGLMLGDDELTRLRAQRVLQGVTKQMLGFEFGTGWDQAAHEDSWRGFWSQHGINYQDPPDERKAGVNWWIEQLRERKLERVIQQF